MRKRTRLLVPIIVVLFIALGCFPLVRAYTQVQEEFEVFVDTDAGPDDFSALMYLLRHPSVTVIGIGISCGVSYVDRGVSNTLRVLEYLGIDNIPVAAGKYTPLVVDHSFPKSWRESSNNSYGLDLPTTSQTPSEMNASELMISLISGVQENVTIVSLGPLTNIAIALEAQPSIKSKIDKIHIMGGAVEVAGNVGPESGGAIPNYVAEWNMWVDPQAADIVFKSGVPITMISLDATNHVPVTEDFKTRLEGIMLTPEARLVYNATVVGVYFWDQLTAVSLTNPEVVTFEEHHIAIVVDLLNHEGQTNSTGASDVNAIVAVNADADAFEDLFIGYINGDLPATSTSGGPIDPLLIIAVLGGVAVVAIGVVVYMRRK
jgi:inosine-uridine nucleoside N-ribohydrolase